jgi:hypothetical protein
VAQFCFIQGSQGLIQPHGPAFIVGCYKGKEKSTRRKGLHLTFGALLLSILLKLNQLFAEIYAALLLLPFSNTKREHNCHYKQYKKVYVFISLYSFCEFDI